MKKNIVINDLVNYTNLKIVQNKEYFNFSLDSVLLPNFINIKKNTSKILDLCTGNAPIPLILSTKTTKETEIYAVELQKEIYELAKQTIKINKLENKIKLINDDVKNLLKIFNTDSFDLITCNPPYFKYKKESLINENEVKSIARHEIKISLEDIIKISKVLLKNNAPLALVHRTERLVEIISLMKENNIEPKRIRLVYPNKNSSSNIVLIEGRKNALPGLKIEKPLYAHDEDGSYTEEILQMFKEKE